MHTAILLYDGFDELDGVGPYRVICGAASAGADSSVSLCTLDGKETVTASNGLVVEPDGRLEETPDLLVVPGGGWNDRADSSAWAEAERGVIPDAIGAYHDEGATIAGVCTGAMLLARAGLLQGRPAVTHAGALDDLRKTGGRVTEARVVDDGDVLTCGGVTAGIDLALHIVEREFGENVARSVATTLEHERRGPVVEPK